MFETALGGTELMYNELFKRIPENLLTGISIFNYPSQADFSKKLVYWNQLSYDQDAVQFLQQKQNIDSIDLFVFVGSWQAEQFRKIFNIPGDKIQVIKNACIGVKKKSEINTNKKIKICYTSTPWRGLDVLLKAWELLNPKNCELHIFSSCKIYGKEFAKEDSKYEFLYDWCKKLSNVVYRGSIPNNELRNEISEFDILAYPNTFEETSCISVIEALSAGLRVITTTLGSLPETTEGWAKTYSYVEEREKHAQIFSKILSEEIDKFRKGELTEQLLLQSEIYSKRWHWDERIKDWIYFLNTMQNPIEK
jgi:glycosyltransferase involved in cell wall biosynthesis